MAIRPLQPMDIDGSILPESISLPKTGDDPSVLGASMRQDNLLVSTYVKNQNKPGPMTQSETDNLLSGNYKYSVPPGHEAYEKEYARYDISPRHHMWVKQNIDQQLRDKETLDSAGIPGFLASTLAAMTSPEQYPFYFIGGNVLLNPRVMRGSRSAGKIIAAETAIGATAATVSEVGLHQTQATRTTEESAFAIGASALFSGLLTGGIIGMKGVPGATRQALADLDQDQRILDMEGKMIEMEMRSVGAAEADAPIAQRHASLVEERRATIADPNADPTLKAQAQRELDELTTMAPERLSELKSPRLAKWLGFANPVIRMAASKSHAARELTHQLIDSTMTQIRHGYGDALNPSIESRMTQFSAEMGFRTEEIMDTVFSELKKIEDKSNMKFDDFAKEVGKALRNGDTDVKGNVLVTKAAKMMREEVFKPIEARLDAQDLLGREVNNWEKLTREDLEKYLEPDDIDQYFRQDGLPKANIKNIPADVRKMLMRDGTLTSDIKIPVGDESYLHRMWDFESIENNKQLFRQRISDYIYNQAIDAEYKATVGAAQENLDALDIQIAKLESEVSKQKTKKKVTEETPEQALQRQADVAAQRKAHEEAVRKGEAEGRFVPPKRTKAQTLADTRLERVKAAEGLERAKTSFEASKVRIQSQADNAALKIEDAILSSSYNPTIRPDRVAIEAGALKMRAIDIPSAVVEDFLENDVTKVLNSYVRSINSELHLKERFAPSDQNAGRTGDAGMSDINEAIKLRMEEVKADYDKLENAALSKGDNKGAQKIVKERDAFYRDFEAMIEVLQGTYKQPDNPTGFWSKARRRLSEFNTMTMLGMVAFSSIPDIGNVIARHGMRGFAKGIGKLTSQSEIGKMNRRTLKRLGLSADLINSSRFEKMMQHGDDVPLNSQGTAGRLWRNMQVGFSKATGMPYWNNAMKSIVAGNFSEDVMRDALLAASGKLDAKKTTAYARAGLSKDMMKRISKQLDEDQIIDGSYVLDPDSWVDQGAADAFKAAIRKEVDTTIVTPGAGDLPLFSRTEVGKLVTQFKSFAFAANQRILLAGLDDFNVRRLEGLITAITLGWVSYAVKQTLKGEEFKSDYDTFIREGLDRSGQLAFWSDLNGIASKITAGGADVYRLTGADKEVMSRYASRNVLGAMLGISAGRISDVAQLSTAVAKGEFTESDIKAVRRALIYNNLWATHYGLSKMMGLK